MATETGPASPVWRCDRLGVVSVLGEGDASQGERSDAEGRVWARVDKATGFLHGEARIARTGVQIYSDGSDTWGEYRDASEVFAPEAMASFARAVMTDDHPRDFVTADTARGLQVGHLGDAIRRDGNWLVAPFTVTDGRTIRAIRDGKVELSAGYWSRTVPGDGYHDGERYAYRQTEIRANHLAVVDRARAGRDARIPNFDGAAFEADPEQGETMTKQSEAPKGDTVREDSREAPAPVDRTPTADAATLARLDTLEAENASLRAALDAEREQQASRIDARVDLVSKAKAAAPEVETRGKTDAEIRRAVLDTIAPEMSGKLDARAGVEGYLEATFDLVVDRHLEAKRETADAFAAAARRTEAPAPKAGAAEMRADTLEAAAAYFGAITITEKKGDA